jgi:hypothetical protein
MVEKYIREDSTTDSRSAGNVKGKPSKIGDTEFEYEVI